MNFLSSANVDTLVRVTTDRNRVQLIDKKKGSIFIPPKMLNSGKAIHAEKSIPEHTKRGVVAQVHFCEK